MIEKYLQNMSFITNATRWRWCRPFLVLFALLSPPSLYATKPIISNFDLIKAGLILTFPDFISWPEHKNCDTGQVNLAIFGEPELVDKLLKIAKGSEKQTRNIRNIEDMAELQACDYLYISPSLTTRNNIQQITDIAKEKSILTIGNKDGIAKSGIMINLYISGNTVKFELNQRAMESAGFKPSYKLLKLARTVD